MTKYKIDYVPDGSSECDAVNFHQLLQYVTTTAADAKYVTYTSANMKCLSLVSADARYVHLKC